MLETPEKFDLNAYIPCRMATLTHTIMRSVAAVFEDRFGISIPEWKVLAIIHEAPGLSAVAVARCANMDTVAVSRAVTKLMDVGYVVRDLDTEDRRRSVLNLSEEGHALHSQVAPVALDIEKSLFDELSDEEMQVFEKVMQKLGAKSGVFADAFSAPSRLMARPAVVTATQVRAKRFGPQQPAPLINYKVNRTVSSAR